MAASTLPGDGEVRLGAVPLPPGRRIIPVDGLDRPLEPVAWVTSSLVPDPGLVWSALSDAQAVTGLTPVLLADAEDDSDYFFEEPSDVAEVDQLDGAAVLRARWRDKLPSPEEEAAEPGWADEYAPFSRQFPGLAPAQQSALSAARLHQVLSSLPPARIGLIAAGRPADALPVAGWLTFDDFREYDFHGPGPVAPPVWIAAVLRTWEDRFGARLLNAGPGAEIRLLVQRPPTTREVAQGVAAEHYAFADECDGLGRSNIKTISSGLVDAAIWQFWWD